MTLGARFPGRQTLPVGEDRSKVDDWWVIESALKMLDRLADRIVPAGGVIASEQARQSVLLLRGDHRGFKADCAYWRVAGTPGAVIRNVVTVESGIVVFDKVGFRCSPGDNNAAAMVVVKSGAYAVFNDCHFYRDSKESGALVSVASGGKVAVGGCIMEPANTALDYAINNAGAALNVYVTNNVNTTGAPHNNVTIISELT